MLRFEIKGLDKITDEFVESMFKILKRDFNLGRISNDMDTVYIHSESPLSDLDKEEIQGKLKYGVAIYLECDIARKKE